jgi:hypothetical protein
MAGSVKTTFYVDKILRKQAERMPTVMTQIATTYANEVKMRMRNSPASGKTYPRGRRRVHRASAPGEAPAPDTGNLLRHVQWRIRNDGFKNHWFAEVGATVKYALYLEYGAAKGVRNKAGRIEAVQWILYPRPVWGPALVAIQPRLREILGSPRGWR